MEIKGFLDFSMLDWRKKLAATLFLPGCNFRCPFCYNVELVLHPDKLKNFPQEEIFKVLKKHSNFYDGVCITGGEPTTHEDLPDLCKKIKKLGLGVKIDTNGTNPEMIKRLIQEKLVDYVAMDVKAQLDAEKYSKAAGIKITDKILKKLKATIELVMKSGIDYEFRTTVVPTLHTAEDIEEIAKTIKGAKHYTLQKFEGIRLERPHIDSKFNDLEGLSDEEMEKLAAIAGKYVKEVELRGRRW